MNITTNILISVLLLLVIATQQTCSSSPTSLYGISPNKQLVKIDPLSFNITAVVGSPEGIDVGYSIHQGIRIDTPDYFVYWLAKSPSGGGEQLSMRLVDTWQASATYSTKLPFLTVHCFTIDYTTSNNILVYGITNIEKPSNRTTTQLGRVNIAGNSYVPLANYYAPQPTYEIRCDYDAYNQLFFVENDGDDKGLDGANGNILQNYYIRLYVEALNWDPKTGLFFLFGVNDDEDKMDAELYSLNANKTDATVVGRFPGYWGASATALDPVNRIFYALSTKLLGPNGIFLLTIDIDTGKLLNSVLACENAAACPSSLSVLYNRADVKSSKKIVAENINIIA